jgi:hypothetical protein
VTLSTTRRMRAARPETARGKQQFRIGVLTRDEYRCRMQIWRDGQWVECGSRGSGTNPLDPSHIYASDNCGPVKWKPIVGIASCRNDHRRYEGKLRDGVVVRVPPDREELAYRAITLAVTKWRVPRHKPPERPAA